MEQQEYKFSEEDFWNIIEKTNQQCDGDKDYQAELITEILSVRPFDDLFQFDRIINELYSKSYRSDWWGVAYLINGGCSDDGFDYFRLYVISLGRRIFEEALDNPETYILEKGGHILIALYNDEPVGVCALIKTHNDPEMDYELAKMAVSPRAQGKKIGWIMGQEALQKARTLGAKALFLESNTILTPAITLYYKLGFQKIEHRPSPYERSNIQMKCVL